ncbi:MAG: LysR family hydrogen peroxide-inducible transcriptional activator [Paracoccaceae bacterium]|jgi:LysR family hydrogen peroxide-inducible transcriptional activator
MRPTLRQLEYIVAVANTGRFSLAASLLNVSQPSLSAQISEAETELGLRVFERGRAGVKVTLGGADVLRRARLILRDVEDLRAAAKGNDTFEERLRLGVLPSIGPYLLPNVVRALHLEYPKFRLVIREENTRDLEEGLRTGSLDMIISTPEDHPGCLHIKLFEEGLWVAVALDDPISSLATPLNLTDLKGRRFLTLGPRFRLSHMVAVLAGRCGAHVSDAYEGTSLDAIRLMAATGNGVALLPHLYAVTEARRGTDIALRPLNAPGTERQIALIQDHTHAQRPANRALAEVLIREADLLMKQ